MLTESFRNLAPETHIRPSKHETSTQCCCNVGPLSATLAQHYNSIGSTSRVCWDMYLCIQSIIHRCTTNRRSSTVGATFGPSFLDTTCPELPSSPPHDPGYPTAEMRSSKCQCPWLSCLEAVFRPEFLQRRIQVSLDTCSIILHLLDTLYCLIFLFLKVGEMRYNKSLCVSFDFLKFHEKHRKSLPKFKDEIGDSVHYVSPIIFKFIIYNNYIGLHILCA